MGPPSMPTRMLWIPTRCWDETQLVIHHSPGFASWMERFFGPLDTAISADELPKSILGGELPTNRKWVITLVINGISGVSPLITRVITHLLSGMNHQVSFSHSSVATEVNHIWFRRDILKSLFASQVQFHATWWFPEIEVPPNHPF